MTKDKIKKALEVCIDIYATCDDCLYNGVENCDDRMRTDVLKLIIEQENEIEQLKAEVKQAKIDVLNKVKTLIFQKDNPYNVPFEEFISANVFCGYIDELIKEVENE
jgi:hypothetical protein